MNISFRPKDFCEENLRLISEMAQDKGISINEVFSFLAEDSVIDLESKI